MIKAHGIPDKFPRRRSLLPQRSNTKHTSTHIASAAEQTAPRDEVQHDVRLASGTDIRQRPHNNTPSMLPPPGLSGSTQEPTRVATQRRPSTQKPTSRNSNLQSTRVRTTSEGGQNPQNKGNTLNLGRAVSHQIERSGVPRVSSSRFTLSQPSSTKTQRPAFTAMQQSFTPKKPGISRPSSPTRQPTSKDKALSAEGLHLQMELAQLHLLHRSSQKIQCQWEQSAEGCCHKRFTALSERHAELREIADQQHALVNQLALVHWSKGKPGPQIAESVALLSHNITDICSVIDAEGKYTRVMEVFESWFAQALQIREQRKHRLTSGDSALDILEGIGDGWKAESMVLERELTYCLREIKAFGSIRPDSSLGRMLSLYIKLILDMVEELDMVQWIENEVSIQEISWIESTIQKLASDVNDDIGSRA